MNDGNENSQINNKDSISNIQNLDSNPYFTYFNNAPLALWIEDLSSAKSYLEIKAKEHNTDAKTYLIQNPDLANELAKMVVVKDVNQTAVDLYKAKSKEDLFQNLDKIFVESSYDGFATLLIDVFLGNKDSQVETVNKTLEGNEFQILLKFTITDPSLEHVIIAIEDISERVKIREQLTISKLRYKEAQAISKLGSWSYDFKSNEVYWSDEIYKTIGVDPQSFVPDLNFLNSLIIDEDKDKALDFSIDFLLKNRRQQLTYRILTPKKKLKYINEYRNVIVENNRIVKIAGTSQDITKSILAEQVLNDTKTLLSDTISSIKEGYILLDKNFNYTYVNEKAAGLVGKKSIDLIGKNIWEEFPEVINNKFQTHCFSVLENKKPISFESHIKPWNKWYESRIIPSNDGLLISFHEITEKIISKNKIKEAYNIINKSSSVAILFKNEFDFPIIFASENAQNLFGYTHEEFTGGKIKIHETVLSEDLPIIRDQVFQLLKNNTDTTIKPEPYRIVTKNKTIKWVKSNIDVIRNEEGYITHIQGIVEDYTDRKKVEDAFFKTNQLITDQFNNTPLASIITDISFNVIEWNNSAERIFGYSAKEAIGKNLNDLIILPNLKIEVQKLRESIISNKKGYKNTNENVRKDGEIIICDWYNVTLKDASNNVIGIASLADDITERKKTEVLLFEKNQLIKDQFNNTPLASIITDNNFNVIEWNNSAKRIFGYSLEEVIGKNVNDLIVPSNVKKDILQLRETIIGEKGGFRNTNENIRKDGEIIICDWYNVTLKDSYNNIIGIASLGDDITDRIHSKKMMEKSEKKYKDIFEKSYDAVLILKDNVFVDCNAATLKMFGYETKEELFSKHPAELSPEFQVNNENSFDKAEQLILNAIESGSSRFRWNHKRKNGEVFLVDVTLTLIEDIDNKATIHTVLKDISAEYKKEQIETILYNISKAVLTIDDLDDFSSYIKRELHKVIDTSNFYIALLNEKTDMLKMAIMVDEKEHVDEFPAENSLTGYVIKMNKPLMIDLKTHVDLVEKGILKMVGTKSKIWVGAPLKMYNKVIGAITVQSYTNENAYKEEDLQLLEFVADQIGNSIQRKNIEDELKKALLKAQESDKLKSAFLANMSHEIRTPMNGIIGFSELLLDVNIQEKDKKRYANIIVNSSKQLLNIVNDILDISKIEAGVIKMNYQSTSINKLIDDLFIFYKPIAFESNIEIRGHKGLDSSKSIIEIDGPKLHQVLTNLLSNAFKFTNEGSIEFGYSLKNNDLLFFVKDTGIGIEEDMQQVIFDRFTQAELNLKKQSKGTGLGLAISKKFIEIFKGEIWLESSANGTTFYFTIPYTKSKFNTLTSVVVPKTKITPIENMELTILIAEDEEYNMLYINELLSNTNIKIIEAFNGKEAIELAQKHPEIVMIFMDIKMPMVNGYEAMHEIKKVKPTLPIVALSAFAMESDRDKALQEGFDDYLTKPLDRKKLFEIMSRYAPNIS